MQIPEEKIKHSQLCLSHGKDFELNLHPECPRCAYLRRAYVMISVVEKNCDPVIQLSIYNQHRQTPKYIFKRIDRDLYQEWYENLNLANPYEPFWQPDRKPGRTYEFTLGRIKDFESSIYFYTWMTEPEVMAEIL